MNRPRACRAHAETTFLNVSSHLTQGGYQIIHFCGHARFDEANPRLSSLVLLDRDLTANAIYSFMLRKPPAPVLCFVNACETAKPVSGKDQFNVYGGAPFRPAFLFGATGRIRAARRRHPRGAAGL